MGDFQNFRDFHRWEYLLFNIAVLLFPLLFSFEKKIRFYKKWGSVFPALFLGSAVFLAWDLWAVGRHWDFNPRYNLGLCLFGLPFEEWLFFLCVPFANLFVWENVKWLLGENPSRDASAKPGRRSFISILVNGFAPGALLILGLTVTLLFPTKEYLLIALMVLAGAVLLDRIVLGTKILQGAKGFLLTAIFVGLTLLANGYLTWRPVVVYQGHYLLGLRMFHIPIEDFVFGLAHLVAVVSIYEWFQLKKRVVKAQ